MMNVFKAMVALAIAIGFASNAQAGWIDVSASLSEVLTAGDGELPLYQLTGTTINYDFAVEYDGTTNLTIDGAMLAIEAIGADNTSETYTASIGSTTLGPLLGDGWNVNPKTTPFSGLESLMPTANGPLTITIGGTGSGYVDYVSSTLAIDYTYQVYEPDPVVPAPSAIILCGLGTGLVGWLRRRRLA